ncbi:interleukin-17 receptor C [Rhinoderma darwinii]|uniref:interleukin-17 receptor C n=1 Tax=Rhinoderma darwinii TaxID=43563 RepID=UPI003F66940F
MKRLAFCPLLLALILHHGICDHRIRLETLPSNAQHISCTGDLQCNSSDTLCVLGDMETAEFPVLIPTDIRAKTMKRCNNEGCQLFVQVTMDMSVAFISEFPDELGSGDCDDYYDADDENEDEDGDSTDVSLYIRVNNPSNDSLLCANLFILRVVPTSFLCSFVRVSLPQSSVPRRIGLNNSIKMGSVVYNSVNAMPGNDFNITTYTYPMYNEELHVHHNLPGCLDLDPKENIVECEAPILEPLVCEDSNNMSVGVVKENSARNTTLRVFYRSRHKANDTTHTLYGEQRYIFPKSHIVPCLCFEAWYNGRFDAVRNLYCPFTKHSEEKVLKESVLIVRIEDNTPLYNLSAPCNLSAQFSLCWKPNDHSECQEIPHTRKTILSEEIGTVKLEHLHPSLCLQVSVKENVLHTYCLPDDGTKQKRNEATILVSKHENTSFCFVGKHKCVTLEEATQQMRRAEFLEQKIVADIITEQCMRIFKSDENSEIYICSADKYMRSRWNWSRVLCLLAVACVLLIILLKNENLIKWLKSVTAEKSLSEIFNDRRILILYSPDNQEYEALVQVFASSLKDLQLDVVLDQWHRLSMSQVNPLPWYHQEKLLVFEKKGLIILLFSEGAREKYLAWEAQNRTQHVDPDPYQSFGAVLNCVQSDFFNKTAKGRYVVATFSSSHPESIPKLFNSVPVYELPLCLEKLLKEISGVNAKKLGHKQVNRLSEKIRDRLAGRDIPESMNSCVVAVELEPLMQTTSNVS